MFPGFQRRQIDTGPATINLAIGGAGPPVLLLHGYPQTHAMWHKIAPRLAERFTVVAADLRGYGDSSKPPGGPDHAGYAKRAMAADLAAIMTRLGFARFAVAGHDRGGRVAHRLALDYPDRVSRLAVLDICPTLEMFEATNQAFATGYYHWFFLIQPFDLAERMIGADPEFYLRKKLGHWGRDGGAFAPEALAEYIRCFRDPATIHATCEDYRAAAGIDLDHDRADRHVKLDCPVLALWGAKGFVQRMYDVLDVWRRRARDVRGAALPCGHFLAEEAPEETYRALVDFLS
jgi:haloacetate dehalogenase